MFGSENGLVRRLNAEFCFEGAEEGSRCLAPPPASLRVNDLINLHMFLHSTRQFQCYHTGWLNKETFYQIKLKEQIQHAPVAEQPLRLDSTELRSLTDVVSMGGGLEKNKRLCYSYYG